MVRLDMILFRGDGGVESVMTIRSLSPGIAIPGLGQHQPCPRGANAVLHDHCIAKHIFIHSVQQKNPKAFEALGLVIFTCEYTNPTAYLR